MFGGNVAQTDITLVRLLPLFVAETSLFHAIDLPSALLQYLFLTEGATALLCSLASWPWLVVITSRQDARERVED
jgi:hypothetical protein